MMIKHSYFRTTFFSLLLSTFISHGAEWKFEELNCSITLPEGNGWETVPPMPDLNAVGARSKKSARSILLNVIPLPNPQTKLNSSSIEGFKNDCFPPGKSKNVSWSETQFRGVPAYRAIGERYMNNNELQRGLLLFIADGRIYKIVIMKLGEDPFKDEEIRASIASFRFLKKPSF